MDLDSECVATQGQRNKRSRFGCNTCRARKVKCDERPNGCANCERLHLQCSGYHQPTPKSTTPDSGASKSRRTYRSCTGCRIARTKCSGGPPICEGCQKNNRRCSFQESTERSSTASSRPPEGVPPQAIRETYDGELMASPSSWNSPVATSVRENTSSNLPWLTSRELPDYKHIRVLVASYFHNFHTLRCFAFIHKPSFLCDLDSNLAAGVRNDALLHIICTLGAQFYAQEHSDTVQQLPDTFILQAGSHWAKTALSLLLDNMDNISVERLMTAQLLYDYALRRANFAQAFMLSALMARMTQALQINLEYSADLLDQPLDTALSVTTRECRRRLMWSCYVTDALCGSGVDQLTLIDERDIKIQLPCNEITFFNGRPCITKTLNGSTLPFLRPESVPANPAENMGILAYFVQHVEIRKRVLRYIKHLDSAMLPWLPNSEFDELDKELRAWYQSLPANMAFTTSNVYMRKESNQLGALCLLHCAFHQTMCDLYRLGTPAIYKLRSAVHFPPEQRSFQKHLQWTLFEEARTLAAIIAEAEQHGPRMIGDSWLPTIAYNSNRIMLYFLTQEVGSIEKSKEEVALSTIPLLRSNLRALKTMRATNAVADGLARAAETMMEKLGVASSSTRPWASVVLDDPYLMDLGQVSQSGPGISIQRTPDYVLNPLSIYQMARKAMPERQGPERRTSSSVNTPAQGSSMSVDSAPCLPSLGDQSSGFKDVYDTIEGLGPNLDIFFRPNLAWDWQPAETGMEDEGLAPWVGASPLTDFTFMTPDC